MVSLTQAFSLPSSCGARQRVHGASCSAGGWAQPPGPGPLQPLQPPASAARHSSTPAASPPPTHRQVGKAQVVQRLLLRLVHPVRQLRGHAVAVLEDGAEQHLLPSRLEQRQLRGPTGCRRVNKQRGNFSAGRCCWAVERQAVGHRGRKRSAAPRPCASRPPALATAARPPGHDPRRPLPAPQVCPCAGACLADHPPSHPTSAHCLGRARREAIPLSPWTRCAPPSPSQLPSRSPLS